MIIIILKDIHQFHEIFLCSQLKVTQGNLTSRNGAAKYQPTNFETPSEFTAYSSEEFWTCLSLKCLVYISTIY